MVNLRVIPTKTKDYLIKVAGLVTSVWVLSLVLSLIGVTTNGPSSPTRITLSGLVGAFIFYVVVVGLFFILPLTIMFYSSIKAQKPDKGANAVDYVLVAGVAILSLLVALRGNAIGFVGMAACAAYLVFGTKPTKGGTPNPKTSNGLRYGAYFGGLSLIPLAFMAAQTSRFAELSSSCDACGDAYLSYIFVVPAQLVFTIICSAAGFIYGKSQH